MHNKEVSSILLACVSAHVHDVVKWLSAGGLRVVACRTPAELVASRGRIVLLDGSCQTRGSGFSERLCSEAAPCCITFRVTDSDDARPGAVDFVLPRQLARLVRHLGTLLEESEGSSSGQLISLGPVLINSLTREVCTAQGEVKLTALQFDLLSTLASDPGKVFSPGELMAHLERLQTGRREAGVIRYHVARLRARLGAAGEMIENVRGCGYRARGAALD